MNKKIEKSDKKTDIKKAETVKKESVLLKKRKK